jgi:hypothetical protein
MPVPPLHLDEDTLEEYVMGRLSREAIAEAEKHLLLCALCRERLKEEQDFKKAFLEALKRRNPRS